MPAHIKNEFLVDFYPKLTGLPFLEAKHKEVMAKMRKFLTFNLNKNKNTQGKNENIFIDLMINIHFSMGLKVKEFLISSIAFMFFDP